MEAFLKKKFRLYKKCLSESPLKTAAIARSFAGRLNPGDVTGLSGGLGAGKTHFVKGAAGFFGFKPEAVVSPTFNLVKEHKKAGKSLYHFDLYRLKNAEELEKTGYWEYISDENAVTFIEWPDRIKETWKDYEWVVELKHKGKNKRQINIYKKKSKVISQKSKLRQKSKQYF
jgi:tRNA threonylcarbamoyladenosine biosynthesis protein TsaE